MRSAYDTSFRWQWGHLYPLAACKRPFPQPFTPPPIVPTSNRPLNVPSIITGLLLLAGRYESYSRQAVLDSLIRISSDTMKLHYPTIILSLLLLTSFAVALPAGSETFYRDGEFFGDLSVLTTEAFNYISPSLEPIVGSLYTTITGSGGGDLKQGAAETSHTRTVPNHERHIDNFNCQLGQGSRQLYRYPSAAVAR